MRLLFGFLLVLSALALNGQNKESYFKYYRDWSGQEIPSWAQLMYSEDPDVREVDYLFEEYFINRIKIKDLHVRNYNYWRKHIRNWIDLEGKIRQPSPQEEKMTNEFLHSLRVSQARSSNPWVSLGPVETYQPESLRPISFQANVYSISQSLSHRDLLIAGTESGGIFKSENRGADWQQLASQLEITSVKSVGIDPNNPQFFLAAANERIFRSLDRGENWEEVAHINGQGYEFLFPRGDSNKIYCASASGLYLSEDQGFSWRLEQNLRTWDIVQHPIKDSVLYLLQIAPGNISRPLFKKSNNYGKDWQTLEEGWYQPEREDQANAGGGKIAVSLADPERVYAALIGESKLGDDGWIGLFRSDDAGEHWYLPAGQVGGPYQAPNQHPWNIAAYSDGYHQGFYNFSLGVSSIDADRIWIGTVRLTESKDGGYTFESIGAANSIKHNLIHADVQYLLVNKDEIWIATDGGIDYSKDELETHTSLKRGIFASDYWGFGTGWNEDVLFGGKYHNGNGAYYQSYGLGNYLHVGGVEEATGYVNRQENRQLYFNEWWAGRTGAVKIPDDISGKVHRLSSLPLIPNENYVESSSSGIYFDPNYSQHLFMGSGGGIWFSDNGGARFDLLHEFGPGKVYEIVLSRNNPKVMYAVYHEGGFWDGCDIYKTDDGGVNWNRLERIPANRWRLEISLSPENDQELWVATARGQNGAKVFRTLDGGESWANMSSDQLNDQQMRDIIHQEGTEGIVYLATNRNVFYFDGDAWQVMSEGLPFAINSLSLSIFYRDSKLRLSTYGRGLWETALVEKSRPRSLPMTQHSEISCARDTLFLDCHSVLEHDGAMWNWEITPEPEWISDPFSRNPSIVLGKDGIYDVQLSIQDKEGNLDSREIGSFFNAKSSCSVDPDMGFSMAMEHSGDFFQISNLNLQSNTMTVMAWIKPEDIQNSYAAIFMNDGETAGFNFRDNNVLGYHWPNGAWWWDSGLRAKEGEWNHVAMVVESNGITLYLNGQSAKHTFTVPEVFFQSVKVGNYKGWGDRNMKGEVEELSIWNRALSEEEIRLRRHLILSQDSPITGLIAYYQFNETTNRVNDRIGNAHGQLNSGAHRAISTAPAGWGRSAKVTLDSNTPELNLDSIGWRSKLYSDEDFSAEAIVTQIENPHYDFPQGMIAPYWITNLYSNSLSSLYWEMLQLKVQSNENQQYTQATLETRGENNFGPQWQSQCQNKESDSSNFFLFDGEECLSLEGSGQWALSGLNLSTFVQNKPLLPNNLVLYPNPLPSGENINFKNKNSQKGRLLVYTTEGKLLRIFPLSPEEQSTYLSLPPGQYLWQWRGNLTWEHGVLMIH